MDSPSKWINSTSLGLSILELSILHPPILLISILNFAVLSSTKILHPNLRFILQVQSGCIVAFEFYRLFVIADEFFTRNIYSSGPLLLQKYGLFVTVFRNSLGHILLIERLLATFFYQKYEKYQKWHFSFFWFSLLTLISLLNCFTTTENLDFTLPNFLTTLALFLLSFVEYLSILLMGFYNKRKYHRFLPAEGRDYSLTQKYQLAENIRTSRQLGPAFFCHLLNNSILSVGGGFMHFEVASGEFQIMILIQICVILSSLVDLAIEITVITHHPLLKKRFCKFVTRIFLCKSQNRVGDSEDGEERGRMGSESPPKAINGEMLIRRQNPENHFRMLARSWN